MKKIFNIFYVLLFLMALPSCHGHSVEDIAMSEIDSLNNLSYHLRYKNLSKAADLAAKAYMLASPDYSDYPQVLNNMGFCAYMEMDFVKSMDLFSSVVRLSDNEVECLVADVGMMKICQRTSSNKEFYDYRNRAQRRIKRIKQDRVVKADSILSARFNYALSEYHITSGVYFYYLQQEKESMAEIDAIDINKIEADTAQMLNYMYMRGSGGMYSASSAEDMVIGEFGYLMDCLRISHEKGYVYFEANALQAMAEILNFRANRALISQKRKGWLEAVNENDCPLDSLPLNLARRALGLFQDYGDWYQISGAYRTMATYYNYIGMPEKALPLLDMALQYVNMHHEKFYECSDTTDRLKTFDPDIPYSLELKWINKDGIKTVPEWIARLREQLSRTYSAMGMKIQSDYNRNIYLDILDYTRQDKELESRYAALDRESYLLNVLLMMIMLGFFVLVVVLVVLNRFWRLRNNIYMEKLGKVLEVCRNITAAVPENASGADEVVRMVEQAVRLDILSITASDDLWIELLSGENGDDRPEWVGETGMPVLDLVAPGKDNPVGRLWLKKNGKLRHDEIYIMKLVNPYMAWTLENGLNLMMLGDERLRLEQEEYIHRKHIVENKRQNEVKKACVAIVTGIIPYIDRVINEVAKLRKASYARVEDIRNSKLDYINELLSKINDYNEILAVWIKMKRGDISLNIENFDLDELFSVISKGRHTFEMKEQVFEVEECHSLVKADKALTMFMINTLIDNARKYTNVGGRIKLSAGEEEDYVEISVTDNGPGLSSADVECILNEKVYDSLKIGVDTTPDTDELARQKGHGFGLMNCKGIIEKYRKTSPLFGVCVFGIVSKPGKGSRFYFRLPKGIKKVIAVLLLLVTFGCAPSRAHNPQDSISLTEDGYVVSGYDSLLSIADMFANMVYESNVRADYRQALSLADSAFYYMNMHYMKYSGKKTPLLDTESRDEVPELEWLADKFDTDYYIILDVRNEVAVASLAVKEFSKYYYNNKAYTTLYKQISEDKSLEQYCQKMQRSSNNKIVAIMLFVVLIIVGVVAYYVMYLRKMLHYRYNMEQVLTINSSVFSSLASDNHSKLPSEICAKAVSVIFHDINELVAIENLVIGVFDDTEKKLNFSWYRDCEDESLLNKLRKSYIGKCIMCDEDKNWIFLPLRVDVSEGMKCIGVMGLMSDDRSVREEDRLLLELVSEYLGVALYHTIVQVEKRFQDIELAKDEALRAEHEENTLHVQNLVLDNCLSTIKHETIYYPGRLKKIVEHIRYGSYIDGKDDLGNTVFKSLEDMDELVNYYKEIFTLLASCASRMLEGVTFRRSTIDVAVMMEDIRKYYLKSIKRLNTYPVFNIELRDECLVSGDEILFRFLLENLIDEALRYEMEGELLLVVEKNDGFARFDFIDRRRNYTQEELNLLFYPDNAKVGISDNGDVLYGAEYLICKQIIRDHDEFGGRRGCRINAKVADDGNGFSVWFTLPLKSVK